jgi:Pentapeptide repeats (8 copies)
VADFFRADLSSSRFERVDLSGAEFCTVDLSHTKPVEGTAWPPPQSFTVRECLLVVLNEEWEHRLYAERDLAVLEARRS